MGTESAAVPGAVVPGKKKKKPRPGSPEQLALQAQRDKRKLFANQATQAREDTYAAQRFSEITDGASQTISKRGVRQRGTSDAQAGTMIREEIAAGKANPQVSPSAGGGFQGTGMDGKPGFQLRTEGERMARIASSPVSGSARPIFSTKGAGSGGFSTAQSDQYRQKALAMGASAKMPGSPNVVKTTASTPPAWDRGAIRGNAAAARSNPATQAGTPKVQSMLPQAQQIRMDGAGVAGPPKALAQPAPAPVVTPAPVATPKPINPNLTSGPRPVTAPTGTPEPGGRPPRFGEPGFKTAAQFATGMTPQLTEQRANVDREFGRLKGEVDAIKNPFSPKLRSLEGKLAAGFQQSRKISDIAKRNAPMQNEQMSMTAQGLAGPPRASRSQTDNALAKNRRPITFIAAGGSRG